MPGRPLFRHHGGRQAVRGHTGQADLSAITTQNNRSRLPVTPKRILSLGSGTTWQKKGANRLVSPINPLKFRGALGRNRTCDTRIRNPVLYPLSYEGVVLP